MDDTKLRTLEAENQRLREENEALQLQALRHIMERALGDDHFSRMLLSQMDQFFPKAPGPIYICILFHGRVPEAERPYSGSPGEILSRVNLQKVAYSLQSLPFCARMLSSVQTSAGLAPCCLDWCCS